MKLSRREMRREKRSRLKESKQLIQEYYSLSWFGQSAAGMVYQLALMLQKGTNDYLWYYTMCFHGC
jgi:hypothetical protein